MFTAYILTFVGFFIILADQNWRWIDTKQTTSFAHSLFGIILIVLTFLQVTKKGTENFKFNFSN